VGVALWQPMNYLGNLIGCLGSELSAQRQLAKALLIGCTSVRTIDQPINSTG
jgi:hypothetical protein